MNSNPSPFVSVQRGDAFKMHTFMQGSSALSISIDKLVTPEKTVDTITEVEDFYLLADDIPGEMIMLMQDNPESPVHDTQVNAVGIAVALMRAALEVAKRQRRGMANVVLCHPDIAATMGVGSPLPLAQIVAPAITETKGRWTNAGMVNNSLVIWTSPDLPKDKLWTAYVGNNAYDSPTCRLTDDGKYEVFPNFSTVDQHFYTLTLAYE